MGCDAIAYVQVFFRDDAVRDEAGDGIVRAFHFGDFERARFVVEAARVGYLPAGFGVDGGAVEDDFRFRTALDFVYRAGFRDDGLNASVAGARAKVKIRLGLERFREFCIGGIGDLFVRAFP